MPPKRIHGEKSRRAPKGYLASTYDTLTSPDNSAVVLSIAAFGPVIDDDIGRRAKIENTIPNAPMEKGRRSPMPYKPVI
ncbi:hypothetical protein E4U22_007193 [Claviceps purpurea]|nr:hypothetical protein E4U22_007193 [Claviceps purpurea]